MQPLGAPSAIRGDFARLSAALVLVEVADAATLEHRRTPSTSRWSVARSRSLEGAEDPSVVTTAFLLKTLVHDGAAPVLDRCASCGEATELVAFDLTEGGLLCRSCRSGRPVSPAAVALLRRMLLRRPRRRAPRGATRRASGEVASIAVDAMEAHVGRRLRAARVVDAL